MSSMVPRAIKSGVSVQDNFTKLATPRRAPLQGITRGSRAGLILRSRIGQCRNQICFREIASLEEQRQTGGLCQRVRETISIVESRAVSAFAIAGIGFARELEMLSGKVFDLKTSVLN